MGRFSEGFQGRVVSRSQGQGSILGVSECRVHEWVAYVLIEFLVSWHVSLMYIDGLPSMGFSKLLSLDFPLLGEIPQFVCMFISDIYLDFPLLEHV